MATPWHTALEEAQQSGRLIDLVDSRFHQNGLTPDPEIFQRSFQSWLTNRSYEPDSRGRSSARKAVSRFYQDRGIAVKEDAVLLTSGTSEAYRLIFTALSSKGDLALLPRPGYPLFEHLAAHARLQTAFYRQPYRLGWQPDSKSLVPLLTKQCRFLVLISPNNPTGQTLTVETLRQLDELPGTEDLVWIVDEVFDACSPEPIPRPGALFPHRKVITLNGISKRFGSPDLKLAWLALSGPDSWVESVSEHLALVNDAYLGVNDYSQVLLPELFTSMNSWQKTVRDLLQTNRRAAELWMTQHPQVEGLLPNGGIHGLWKWKTAADDDEAWSISLLKNQQLSVHPGYFYDVEEPGIWTVYTLLVEPLRFQEGLERLSAELSSSVGHSWTRL